MTTPFSSVSEKFFKIIKVNITTITCLFTRYPFPLSLHAVLLIPYNNIFTNHSLHPHRHPTTIIYVKHMSISLYSLFKNFYNFTFYNLLYSKLHCSIPCPNFFPLCQTMQAKMFIFQFKYSFLKFPTLKQDL
jgi:hypothetical protein